MLLRTFLSIDVPFDDAKVKQVINGCNLISNEIADFVGETIRKKSDNIKERAASVAKMIRNTGALLSNVSLADSAVRNRGYLITFPKALEGRTKTVGQRTHQVTNRNWLESVEQELRQIQRQRRVVGKDKLEREQLGK